MRKKPKGPKYRNLVARDGVIYYQRVSTTPDGKRKRTRRSLETSSWEEAVERKVELFGKNEASQRTVITLSDFAQRYLEDKSDRLARTTRSDRMVELRPEGRLLSNLGDYTLEQITGPLLISWRNQELKGRSLKTVRNITSTLSTVLTYACSLELIDSNPVNALRESIASEANTQLARAEADTADKAQPIEDHEQIQALLKGAEFEGLVPLLYVLLQLDAGLRSGEALAMRWNRIGWGADSNDTRRLLNVTHSRSRGGALGPTKSGRKRKVALARRLRAVLMELNYEKPEADAWVIGDLMPNNFRKRAWSRMLKAADLGHLVPKQLRDSFGSHLLTAGVQLGYVSKQLGHADVSVTARHYARWIDSDEYREPMRLEAGEVPADLLARLGTRSSAKPGKVTPVVATPSIVSEAPVANI